jgi:hypothetical protein
MLMVQLDVIPPAPAPPRSRHGSPVRSGRVPLFVWPIVAMVAMLPVLAVLIILLMT